MEDKRDWQADMELATELSSWQLDPGGDEDGAAFFTIDSDGIGTQVRADNMLGTDAELLVQLISSQSYWLQYAEKWKVPYEVTCKLLENSRERADKAEKELEPLKQTSSYKYIQHMRKKHEEETMLLLDHIFEVEAREQQLINTLKLLRNRTKGNGAYTTDAFICSDINKALRAIYPTMGDTKEDESCT